MFILPFHKKTHAQYLRMSLVLSETPRLAPSVVDISTHRVNYSLMGIHGKSIIIKSKSQRILLLLVTQ